MAIPKTEIEKCDFIPNATIMEILSDTKEPDSRNIRDIVDKAKEAKGLSLMKSGNSSMSGATLIFRRYTMLPGK